VFFVAKCTRRFLLCRRNYFFRRATHSTAGTPLCACRTRIPVGQGGSQEHVATDFIYEENPYRLSSLAAERLKPFLSPRCGVDIRGSVPRLSRDLTYFFLTLECHSRIKAFSFCCVGSYCCDEKLVISTQRCPTAIAKRNRKKNNGNSYVSGRAGVGGGATQDRDLSVFEAIAGLTLLPGGVMVLRGRRGRRLSVQ
jgi:hypothetical protein